MGCSAISSHSSLWTGLGVKGEMGRVLGKGVRITDRSEGVGRQGTGPGPPCRRRADRKETPGEGSYAGGQEGSRRGARRPLHPKLL